MFAGLNGVFVSFRRTGRLSAMHPAAAVRHCAVSARQSTARPSAAIVCMRLFFHYMTTTSPFDQCVKFWYYVIDRSESIRRFSFCPKAPEAASHRSGHGGGRCGSVPTPSDAAANKKSPVKTGLSEISKNGRKKARVICTTFCRPHCHTDMASSLRLARCKNTCTDDFDNFIISAIS